MTPFPHNHPIVLASGIQRLTAPNPGIMTGPGTNTYLVGQKELAVIDPGPNLSEHIQRILQIAEERRSRIRWILCTHTHQDHSPAAAPLQQACDAILIGQPHTEQDPTFQPDWVWQDGDRLETPDFTLTGIHTPGHASNHLCFYHEEQQMLFTGDHLMQGSTVVIAPPDGDMAAYLDSLAKLKTRTLKQLAPAHGHLIDHPQEVIDAVIQHRLKREAKVLHCLERLGPSPIAELTAAVYDDASVYLHAIARHSLLAHLNKLHQEGKVQQKNLLWQTTDL